MGRKKFKKGDGEQKEPEKSQPQAKEPQPSTSGTQLEKSKELQPQQEKATQGPVLPESTSEDTSQQGEKSKRSRRKKKASVSEATPEQQLSQQLAEVRIHDPVPQKSSAPPQGTVWQGRVQHGDGDREGREQQRPAQEVKAPVVSAWQQPRASQPQERGQGDMQRNLQDRGSQQARDDQARGQQQPKGPQDRGQQQPRGPQDRGSQQDRGQQPPWGAKDRGSQQARDDQARSQQQSRGPQDRGQQQPRIPQDKGPGDRQVAQGQQDSKKAAWQDRGAPQQPSGDQRRQPEVVSPGAAKPFPPGQEKGDYKRPTQQPQKPLIPSPKHEVTSYELAVPQRKKLNTAGTAGRRIQVEANHLALTLKNLKTAIHYDVVIEPDTPKRLLRVAVEEFRRKYYRERYPAFDGRKNLYSSTALPISDPFSGEVVIKEDDRDKNYKITIKYAATVDLSVVNKYFEAVTTNRHLVTPQDAMQCLDVVLRSAPSLHCIPVGRSFFTKPQGRIIDLGDGMEMYYGFYQSAILGWKPFLNVDVAHKGFPKSGNVIDIIKELCPRSNLAEPLSRYDRDTVDKFMRTLKVQYEIPNLPATKRVMRVNELDKSASDAKFKTDNGQQLTVQQYFQTEKKYPLRFPHLPCLWVGSKQREQRILIPPELCILLPGQVTNRAMTPMQTSNMIKESATSTHVRKDKIMQSVRQARYNDDPSVREFGFSVSQDFVKVQARILDSPMLTYANNGKEKPRKGVWRSQKFLHVSDLGNKWAIISIDRRTNAGVVNDFSKMLIQCGKEVGMNILPPSIEKCVNLQLRKEKDELETIFKSCNNLMLVIVIIPTDDKDMYNFVKQVAELRVGTLTQCVKGRNAFRPKPATVANILLKINAKLNGVNHALADRPRCLKRPCMIMGADVTHPSPENKGCVPSVAAVTASFDANAFRYNICWRLQPSAQEIIVDLENIVKEQLMYFYEKNKQMKPEQIIFFRDGVSEGQFEQVLNVEVSTIRRACSKMGDGSYQPKITFLVVQKRHHTRFFPTNPRDSEDRDCNVPAGTVVDTEITHPTALDFYLVSHASIRGVARPTKYRMLWDDNDMNEDELEQLTYHLCHLYTRCTRSVSYPAPTYYAHLAAARAKVYCERKQINMNALEREMDQLRIKDAVLKGLPMFFV